MAARHADWMAQAERDLKVARDNCAQGYFEWSAFQSQQAAEKAVKALLRYHNVEVTGHTITALLQQAANYVAVSPDLLIAARELDRHYITPRYPNGFAAGYPAQYYDEPTAQRCIADAERILAFVRENL